jgi:hypothetical protein
MLRTVRRRATVALAVTGGLAALATTFSAPASAGTNCPDGYHCVFFSDFNSTSHEYFDQDRNFNNDRFNYERNGAGQGQIVNDNFQSASNSSTGNYESHYWVNAQGSDSNRRIFCVNPGENATRTEVGNVNGWDIGSSLTLPGRTTVHCI